MTDRSPEGEPESLQQGLLAYTRGCPCDGCDLWNYCAETQQECKTFRRWVQTGKAPGDVEAP
ncbi:coenzyme F420-dependent N5, N10-methylene tetrahydromethanopterin reductase [Thiohalobacter thiocyanaticus]|uniref:Coenzyme F420-dependent N5, N10-methylene tetrahydromethanopterin reductase n=1 Tax=Thiohalobacter thiocyanaticus TaxID=585455 RepID=A0A1Z4VRN9_9GAMM|nr:coenzyme F420-dependent N5, N10-methylene tetrahydromethanopterin reductase [Thiohalobacter thiocyanaticus]